ncbi:helix-turn-helix domain-containing protein [Leucobacter sp. gxy201]|uniref:helix-turn-helix domain-containing protein n=1 Tax=Leucobacter sp. gxy201 TaxID=2957200 RepID=UPI003DA0213D
MRGDRKVPNSDEDAARELTALRKDRGVTARDVAAAIGVTESWLSRRLAGVIDMRVSEYHLIKNAILSIAIAQNDRTPGVAAPGVQ